MPPLSSMPALLQHQVDHRMVRGGIELGRIGVDQTDHVTRELDRHGLQPEAQPQTRHALLAGVPGGGDLSFDPPVAEPTGDHDAVQVVELAGREQPLHRLGLDPDDLDIGPVVEPGVLEALDHRQIGVGQLDVLADEADSHGRGGRLDLGDELFPVGQVRAAVETQQLTDEVVEALVVQDQRQLVDVLRIGGVDDRAFLDVAETGDLALQIVGQRRLAAADDHVGLDAAAAQLGDRVLRGLGLLLARRADERHEGDVDVADVVASDHVAELANRLEERQDLDVTDGAAHLGDHHVDVVVGHPLDTAFDLVGDVRDHLNGLAEVVASAFGGQHRLIDRAGGGIGVARQVLVDEALVVSEVEVGLAAVVGDEHLAVLERIHRARIDVDVRIELLERHP